MTNEDRSWIAGFYEGEGSVYLLHNKYVQIKITQKETSILRKIQQWIGYGEIYFEYRNKFRISKWMCTGKNALNFINLIYPFMRSKRKISQIRRVLNTLERA